LTDRSNGKNLAFPGPLTEKGGEGRRPSPLVEYARAQEPAHLPYCREKRVLLKGVSRHILDPSSIGKRIRVVRGHQNYLRFEGVIQFRSSSKEEGLERESDGVGKKGRTGPSDPRGISLAPSRPKKWGG